MRYATCHPDRKHYGRGFCCPCYGKTYNSNNREKIRAEKATYRENNRKNNPEKMKIERAIYYKNNREELKVKRAAYLEKNREKEKARQAIYGKKNREELKTRNARYAKNNPGKVNARTAKRHTAKLQRTPIWLTKNHFTEIQIFYIEAAQRTKETGTPYHVDHIVPLQGKTVSGLHVPWNLQIIVGSGPDGNCAKGNRFD